MATLVDRGFPGYRATTGPTILRTHAQTTLGILLALLTALAVSVGPAAARVICPPGFQASLAGFVLGVPIGGPIPNSLICE